MKRQSGGQHAPEIGGQLNRIFHTSLKFNFFIGTIKCLKNK
jgi:hypothetical protein